MHYTKIVSMQWEQKPVNFALKYIKISDGKQSAERENSKALQCMEKSWFGRNSSYTWEYQHHIGASSQKIELTLH